MDPSGVEPVAVEREPREPEQPGSEMATVLMQEPSPPAPAAPPVGPVIPPLPVPWLHHDGFMTVKKVCSESGLPQAKKTSVVRVLQELRKGRAHIDQQLVHLETQLLHVGDFLNGVTPTLEIASSTEDEAAAQVSADGDAAQATRNGKGPVDATGDKSAPIDPVATLVEEDLASDTPSTTSGLWRFLTVYQFFKTVTLEDMQEALLLEDPATAAVPEDNDTDTADSSAAFESPKALPILEDTFKPHLNGFHDEALSVHEMLRMRLVAALLPDVSLKSNGRGDSMQVDSVVNKDTEDGDAEMAVENGLWASRSPTRTLTQLRDIGLVEASRDDVEHCLTKRQDDEVSSEIRLLERDLVRQVQRNNEVKRTLRRALERLKPWLTHDDEYQQIEAKFDKMWRRKKELQRKKKHKEKKLQRKEASYKSAFLMPPQPSVPS